MPQSHIDELMNLWAANVQSVDQCARPPFANHQELLDTIDSTPDGSVPWDTFTVSYSRPLPDDEDPPPWMLEKHEVCFRNAKEVIKIMFSNRDFDGEFDYTPRRDYDEKGDRKYKDLYSGDWIWLHAVCINFYFDSIYVLIFFLGPHRR